MTSSQTQENNTHHVRRELLEKYNTTGPRYTSYPTAPVWTSEYDHNTHLKTLEATNVTDATRPLSLYTHLPFCAERCLFCACNVVITKQTQHAETYLGYLFRELEHVASLTNPNRDVVQFHWGGGTPTYLNPDQIERLYRFQTSLFKLRDGAEVAIEVDPRVTTSEQLQLLKELGFNRISLGVQDFDKTVQESVNRVQPLAMVEPFYDEIRDLGFEGVNFDLIYGLPDQTLTSFKRTLDIVIGLSPDRIALYNYAHVPWMAPHQKAISESSLPNGDVKFKIFQMAMERFLDAGYVYIGMDHFAKPDDELAQALNNGKLYRNFMGYTVQGDTQRADLYGFGVSAISGLDQHFAQNVKKLSQYYEAIDASRLPVQRGYTLSEDDVLRREVILDILCQGNVSYQKYQSEFNLDFEAHFRPAIKTITQTQGDGLVDFTSDGFKLNPLGRIFSRNIAMPFDAYLQAQKAKAEPTFSKTL